MRMPTGPTDPQRHTPQRRTPQRCTPQRRTPQRDTAHRTLSYSTTAQFHISGAPRAISHPFSGDNPGNCASDDDASLDVVKEQNGSGSLTTVELIINRVTRTVHKMW